MGDAASVRACTWISEAEVNIQFDAGRMQIEGQPIASESISKQSENSSSPVSVSETRHPYPLPAELPTQRAHAGIYFDFNDGARILLPEASSPWRVRLSDLDTGNILFETELTHGRVNSSKRYF